jgi:hypothetical protein
MDPIKLPEGFVIHDVELNAFTLPNVFLSILRNFFSNPDNYGGMKPFFSASYNPAPGVPSLRVEETALRGDEIPGDHGLAQGIFFSDGDITFEDQRNAVVDKNLVLGSHTYQSPVFYSPSILCIGSSKSSCQALTTLGVYAMQGLQVVIKKHPQYINFRPLGVGAIQEIGGQLFLKTISVRFEYMDQFEAIPELHRLETVDYVKFGVDNDGYASLE